MPPLIPKSQICRQAFTLPLSKKPQEINLQEFCMLL